MRSFNSLLTFLGVVNWAAGGKYVVVDRSRLVAFVQELARNVSVDEEWYYARYPDVKAAVEKEHVLSAKHHFELFGYLEGRVPSLQGFDPARYLDENPDLASIRKQPNPLQAATEHYINNGYIEGRRG